MGHLRKSNTGALFVCISNYRINPVVSSYFAPLPADKWSCEYFKCCQKIPIQPRKFEAPVRKILLDQKQDEPVVSSPNMNQNSPMVIGTDPVCIHLMWSSILPFDK